KTPNQPALRKPCSRNLATLNVRSLPHPVMLRGRSDGRVSTRRERGAEFRAPGDRRSERDIERDQRLLVIRSIRKDVAFRSDGERAADALAACPRSARYRPNVAHSDDRYAVERREP